ncbi:MAG: amino acid permease [Thermodesulfobacteriota bacterium]|nr:amino acid permease [Thermodesulfobacteriota bacterium]
MTQAGNQKSDPWTSTGGLGTFAGVFTPSILTILGIILFMRLGYVVGNAGLGRALIIITLANAISVLTSFSLSAIATNLKVKGGGDYYLISRTLGLEFGGAIGIVLFLAQSVSIAFYCIGFGETMTGILHGTSEILPQVIAALAVSFLFIFAWLGTDWATRFQYGVMAILFVALASFFTGGLASWHTATLTENWSPPASGPGFWILFAIFFPAVTGFTQGVSMSGDLKDAGKSLPLGTFLAVGISILIYFGSAIVLAAAIPGNVLTHDYGAMKRVASFGFLIHAGVIAATLSSAMASFLGAPRILQSLADDRIFPFLVPFAQGSGPAKNPRRGVLLSAVIALATIGLGKLNIIAPVVSMFFLISYGLLNYATYFEARAASPSFRPRFRWFDHRLSLLGWLASLGAMLAIDLASGAVAIAVLFAIYQYLRRTAGPARWADSRRSHYLKSVRENLLAAAAEPEHPRDWRPQILAFSGDSHRKERLLRFASWLEGGSGLTTAVRIVEGEGVKMLKLRSEAETELRKDISQYGLKVFPLVLAAPNLQTGIQTLVQSFGIGPLQANTVLFNWLDQLPIGILGLGNFRYAQNLRVAFRFGCNILLLDAKEDVWESLEASPSSGKVIDVWWWGDSTSRLMLLLAYLMTRSDVWEEASIRVLAAGHEKEARGTMDELQEMLQEVRIEAQPTIIEKADADVVVKHSGKSSIVFLPFRLRRNQLLGPFDELPEDLVSRLPIVAMALAAEDIDLEAEPEEGKIGELAAALDALHSAEEKSRKADEEASKAARDAEEKFCEIQSAIDCGADGELIKQTKIAIETKEKAVTAARKAAKALAKAKDAAEAAEELGAGTTVRKGQKPQ